jgi:beta-glucanase (GH16 family)
VNSSEDQLYTPDNVTVASGQLRLTARREQVTDPRFGPYPYTSGMVSTQRPGRTLFAFRYGFVQARVWIPRGSGLWSAFWLLDAHGNEEPEIDIAENLGQKPDLVDQFVHWLDYAGGRQQFGNELSVPGMYDGWHTYAVDWEPDALTFYVDGTRTWVMDYRPAIPQQDMIVIANLAVGGYYAKTPPPSTKFPTALRFDFIRVFQHA